MISSLRLGGVQRRRIDLLAAGRGLSTPHQRSVHIREQPRLSGAALKARAVDVRGVLKNS
jgi:hypothetical protein